MAGEIAAIYQIVFVDPADAPLILKVYPDDLHWKMQKEATVLGLIQGRLSVPVPRILPADDSKRLLGLNLIVMTKLQGEGLDTVETSLALPHRLSVYAQIGGLLREFHRAA
jgi:hygromycin-B 7''-O-kinase